MVKVGHHYIMVKKIVIATVQLKNCTLNYDHSLVYYQLELMPLLSIYDFI